MIRYYIIVAILSIYSPSTHAAASFNKDVEEIKEHLLDERTTPTILDKTMSKIIPFWEGIDILCDRLDNNQKQSICNQIMLHLIDDDYGPEYTPSDPHLPVPPFVGSADSYTCKGKSIDKLDMQKRMIWCEPLRFIKKQSGEYDVEEGFFCAGSRKVPGRVFAFRAPTLGSKNVTPVGELNDVEEMLLKLPHHDCLRKNSSRISLPSVESPEEAK